ncbi:(3S)-malyl-CoA thioesterase [Desulfuromonas soudanensis]|uniref:Acyl-CoA thioesterase 2 n=1 Tax=Desulfuromonas soudanensis TaxID=1603606 RepID=A0A0M4D0T3_9BACT|nr:acyl-CoA thioesterase II [Desulfuromonas soudanensis]ALC16590.1 (3S)-malyl-CoA thioesterase [Desulfuromonas soudanensis]
MSNLVQDLIEHLNLERLEENLFRGDSRDIGGKSVFGGQVLGQALLAAQQTVEGREAHSLHAYFLRPGNPRESITYDVDRIRDGRSFATRRVVAAQSGRAIFNMSVSFQIAEEGFEHQSSIPDVPPPEELLSIAEWRRQTMKHIPESLQDILTRDRPIELRPVQPIDVLHPDLRPPRQQVWLKAAGNLPDAPAIHKALLAYASDFTLLGTALLPHGVTHFMPRVQAASLDHAMWFHRPFRMDEWLLYDMDSPSACGGRGLGRGSIYSRDGRLIASVAQEGVIRLRREGPPSA